MKTKLTSKRQQLKDITQQIDTCIRHKVCCSFCEEAEYATDCSQTEFAKLLYDWGWREVDSEKYQLVGIACPRCAAMPDKYRGED